MEIIASTHLKFHLKLFESEYSQNAWGRPSGEFHFGVRGAAINITGAGETVFLTADLLISSAAPWHLRIPFRSHHEVTRLKSNGINWCLSKVWLPLNNMLSIISSPSDEPEFVTGDRCTNDKNANFPPGETLHRIRSAKIRWKWDGWRWNPLRILAKVQIMSECIVNIYKGAAGPRLCCRRLHSRWGQ